MTFSSYVEDVDVVGTTAFIAAGNRGVRTIDVTDPTNPVEMASYDTPSRATGILATDSHLYVADRASVQVLEIETLNRLRPVGEFVTDGIAWSLSAAAGRLFVADGSNGVLIFPVDCDDANPVSVDEDHAAVMVPVQVSPNPAPHSTSVSWAQSATGETRVGVFDAAGRRVAGLFSGELFAGDA